MHLIPMLLCSMMSSPPAKALPPVYPELNAEACPDDGLCNLYETYQISESGIVDLSGKALLFNPGSGLRIDAAQVTLMAQAVSIWDEVTITGTSSDSRLGIITEQSILSSGDFDFSTVDGGGALWLSAGQNIHISSGRLDVNSNARRMNGGTIDMWAGAELSISEDTQLWASGGNQGQGGGIYIAARDTVTLNGEIEVHGGSKGNGQLIVSSEVDLFAGVEDDLVTASHLDISMGGSGSKGDGGLVWLSAPLTVALSSDIDLRGINSLAGSANGGSLVVDQTGSFLFSGSLNAQGNGEAARGGTMWLDIGDTFSMEATIDLSATGAAETVGGEFDAVTRGLVHIEGPINAQGCGTGGTISMVSLGAMLIEAEMNASGCAGTLGGQGGSIHTTSLGGDLRAEAPLQANGRESDGGGGDITASGCRTQVLWGAPISATGGGGEVMLTGIDGLEIGAEIDAADGSITFQTRDSDPEEIHVLTHDPEPEIIINPSLQTCTCEDGPGCFDPADQDGDGYASTAIRGEDCDDTDPDVYPGAIEDINDDIDNDCDGYVDEDDDLTGDADDTGEAPTGSGDDTGDTGTDDTSSSPDPDTAGSQDKGCACTTGHAPSALWLCLALLPALARRPQH